MCRATYTVSKKSFSGLSSVCYKTTLITDVVGGAWADPPQKAVDNFDPQRKEMARDNIFLNADDIGSLEMSFFPLGVVEVLNALN